MDESASSISVRVSGGGEMRMLMGKFSMAMMPTSGSEWMSSERKGVYGQSPIYVSKLVLGDERYVG